MRYTPKLRRDNDRRLVWGFTLIELLIVIGIVAILGTVTVLALNPAELLRQARDATRISDLVTLNKGITLFRFGQSLASLGDPTNIYVSLPDPTLASGVTSTCSALQFLPPPPAVGTRPAYKYHCASSADYRKTNGEGWIPLNFNALSSGPPFSALPVDPLNNATSSGLYYMYVPGIDSYVTVALFESDKFLSKNALPDGGTDPARFEVGSDQSLWTAASGLMAYWKLDESTSLNDCSTRDIADSSGNGNSASACNSVTMGVPGKVGLAARFNGTSQYVTAPDPLTNSFLDLCAGSPCAGKYLTVAAWVNRELSNTATDELILAKDQGANEFLVQSGIPFSLSVAGTNAGGNVNLATFLSNQCSVAGCGSNPIFIFGQNNPIPISTWRYLVTTFQDENAISLPRMKMYGDGMLERTKNQAGAPEGIPRNNANVVIGQAPAIARGFQGTIDEPRIYNRVLSDAEINAMYRAMR